MQIQPDYEQKSKDCSDAARAVDQKLIEEVSAYLLSNALKAAQTINSFVTIADEQKLQFDAAKHILKLVGLETDQVKHSGQVDFVPVIFSHEGEGGKDDNEESGS